MVIKKNNFRRKSRQVPYTRLPKVLTQNYSGDRGWSSTEGCGRTSEPVKASIIVSKVFTGQTFESRIPSPQNEK
jgi:hypothetical protein